MSQEFVATRLDVKALAEAGTVLSGQDLLSNYERLLEETGGQGADRRVLWEVRGELREAAGSPGQVWLHLRAEVSLPLVCQRCMGPVDVALAVDRAFRFVATEAEAEVEDEAAEEDVLALSRDFNLKELLEDELLMALPVVPRHEVCPAALKLAVQDADFDAATAEKPNPFAVLAGLRGGKAKPN
jgi:uncharacterized protein